jgi:hypothetical protein
MTIVRSNSRSRSKVSVRLDAPALLVTDFSARFGEMDATGLWNVEETSSSFKLKAVDQYSLKEELTAIS